VVVNNRSYANARANIGVVVVARDSFGTGRRDPMRVKENPFEVMQRGNAADVSIAPPQSRPNRPITFAPDNAGRQTRRQPPREERMRPAASPAQRAVPSLPPERVRNTKPELLRNDRRVVREREGSVFKQQQPENLPVTKRKLPRVIIRRTVPGQQQQRQQGTGQQERKEKRQER